MMKTILGLDIGTNSIGWALIQQYFEFKQGNILGMGSRIIPMTQDKKDEFGKGNSISQTADKTKFRSARILRERHLLRRERLLRVLNILGYLPPHYAAQIDFEKHFGKFKGETEPKLAYQVIWNEGRNKNEFDFIFKKSFETMLEDFKLNQPQLVSDGRQVPYDWTIYYLRKKALTEKIEKAELAWILLNFNQKRGYYQLRGEEEEEKTNKLVEFHALKVTAVSVDDEQKGGNDKWYSFTLENGWIYRRSSKVPLFDWKDKIKDFIVTTDLDDEGNIKTDKDGHEKRSFRSPGPDDWTLLKKKTEQDIHGSGKTVGTYIYDALLLNPKQKIKGKLVRTIERNFYKNELKAILTKQQEFHPELKDSGLYEDCIKELYRNNEQHQIGLRKKDVVHLFLEDIIFYQRPLRSQKSAIGNCTLEYRRFKDKSSQIEHISYLKAISKSNPLYQEFRLWQWIHNLRIYRKEDELDLTADFLSDVKDIEELFGFLNDRKEIDQKSLIKYFLQKQGQKGKLLNIEIEKYRWNFVENKAYPCNETSAQIRARLLKVENIDPGSIGQQMEQELWHLIYSVTDKVHYTKALRTFAERYHLHVDSFIESFRKFPPFKSEYGSFSEKAIKKLLPLLRVGRYWYWDDIDESTKDRIGKILTGEYDENIKDKIREKSIHLTCQNDFQGVQLWLASYIVYGRHSESNNLDNWNSVADLEGYLSEFKQHSLRNPIVEQVITETLRVVKDIWIKYGNGSKDFFSEIHVELGREMKNTAEERRRITEQITTNENTNLRIKALLEELVKDKNFDNVRPYSPMQQEALKIFEDGALNSSSEIPDDILKISKTAQPSASELQRYKLWLEQRYCSPYTGQIIPLNRLFSTDYEIEHIIPQSRFFDDSFSNKIICESAVNKLKDNQLGFEFIKNHGGAIVELGLGRKVKILDVEGYNQFIKNHYGKNRGKRTKLMLDEIPDKMIERQLNDTRYISKFISEVLSNVVRSDVNDDGVNSKNLLPGNGKITAALKQDWGLNDVWNELILPRFERMNSLTSSTEFTSWNENHQKYLPVIPVRLSKGFQKKRIDHRHHALDALIIACATRSHVNFMNNEHALIKGKSQEAKQNFRHDLRSKLCDKKYNEGHDKNYKWVFKKPWESFTVEAKTNLEHIVVSFKQNLRVINKTINRYEKWVDKDGSKIKANVLQTQGDSWAIRKPMHKDTVSGLVALRRQKYVSLGIALDNVFDIVHKDLRKYIQSILVNGVDKKKIIAYFKQSNNEWNGMDVAKVEIYYWELDNVASRVNLDTTFDEKKIKSITDTGIQKILIAHLKSYENTFGEAAKNLAFTPEGIEELNKNILALNDGKFHQPILKVRTYEPKGNKFNVGQILNKKDKYVEAAKGTNLFFAIYQSESGKRSYETIPLNIVIERQKAGKSPVPMKNEKGLELSFYLSPNDLVYVPTKEEALDGMPIDIKNLSKAQKGRIYKVVSFTGARLYAIPNHVASVIEDKFEYTQLNKVEFTPEGQSIKDACVKLSIDRLGTLSLV